MANSPALNGSIAVKEKGNEEDKEKINKKRSHDSDEAQAQASEKHLAPPADQASAQACAISSPPSEEGKSEQYPSGIRLFIIIVALILSVFLVALDMTIIATAIPKVTSEFDSLDQVGWYGSAFFLTLASFQSTWGKLYKYFSLKMVFITAAAVFELGSLACAVAQNSTTLIVGRAITGCGAAGLLSGCYVIVAFIAPPQRRPAYTGIIGAVFGCASVAGPLLGGVFTDTISWRWCFYINLPVGGVSIFSILFFFKTPAGAKTVDVPLREKLLQMDLVGTFTIVAALVCFLLAMQWGGLTKAWNSSEVVGTLVGFVVLTIVFVTVEVFQGERALMVPRLLMTRAIASYCAFIFFLGAANFLFLYYIPIYFQSIGGVSAIQSGIRNLPLIFGTALVSAMSGILITLTGYCQPFLTAGGVFSVVGAALVYTLDIDSSAGEYLGYQAIMGAGVGLCVQVPVIAAQAFCDPADIAPATAIVLFFQTIGGALFVSAAESIFGNRLLQSVSTDAPGVDPVLVLHTGASEIRNAFSGVDLPGVLSSYMLGLKGAWALGLALTAGAVVASFGPRRDRIGRKVASEAAA